MKRGCLIALLVFVVISVLAAGALYGVHRRYCGNVKFNRQQWIALAGKGGMDNPRQRMVKDLRQRYLKPGMTRQEVRHLLGKPDFDSLSKDVDSYFIGADGFDGMSLDVRYDQAGHVIRSDVVQH
jgi:hypothetical protein